MITRSSVGASQFSTLSHSIDLLNTSLSPQTCSFRSQDSNQHEASRSVMNFVVLVNKGD